MSRIALAPDGAALWRKTDDGDRHLLVARLDDAGAVVSTVIDESAGTWNDLAALGDDCDLALAGPLDLLCAVRRGAPGLAEA